MKKITFESLNEKQMKVLTNYTNNRNWLVYKGDRCRHDFMELTQDAPNMFLIAEALQHYADSLLDTDDEKAYAVYEIYQAVFEDLFEKLEREADVEMVPCKGCQKPIVLSKYDDMMCERDHLLLCTECWKQVRLDRLTDRVRKVADRVKLEGWIVVRKKNTIELWNYLGQLDFTSNNDREVAEFIINKMDILEDELPF